jgi:two-component system capsular synthesis response regulator RcsB
MTIRVIVADDHPIFLAGASALFEGVSGIEIVATARSSQELTQKLIDHPCDILLTDFSMPGSKQLDGLVMLRRLQRDFPSLRIIVVTMHDNAGVLGTVAQLKIAGLVSKSDLTDELISAVQTVAEERSYLSRHIRQTLGIDLLSRLPEKTRLSPREAEVLRLFASGLTGNQIAAQLHRSKKTVSRQKINAFHKLGLSNDVEFFVFLRETQLLGGPFQEHEEAGMPPASPWVSGSNSDVDL